MTLPVRLGGAGHARCEARTSDGTRCRCRMRRHYGEHYGEIPDGTGNTVVILCENHRKVLRRGKIVTDNTGVGWRAVFHGPAAGNCYYVEAVRRSQ